MVMVLGASRQDIAGCEGGASTSDLHDGHCRGQDFEKAGQLRDKEMELKAQITAITSGAKESGEAEQEAEGGGGPLVQESDIANIVSQWTGIPIEKVSTCCCMS